MSDVLQNIENDVLWITLNRADVKNALAPHQRDEIIDLLNAASTDDAVRAVVIQGSGGSFCSGADLRGSRSADPPPPVSQVIKEGAQRLINSIIDCEKPVIASVDGVAAGIGAHIAYACDLVLASEGARFIEVFIRRALVPDGGGAYLLVRRVGPHKAKELVFFGGDLHAQDAQELGLVNRVVPSEDLEATTREWAETLAKGPTKTLSLAKKLINHAHDVDRATAFDEEANAQEENMKTEDAQEGVRSFVERRSPDYKGR